MRPRRAPNDVFGPGLLAAASNNDPTTVATLAVIGATTGYGLSWLVVLIIPMLALVQALAADVGAVCKTSLQGAIRRHYGLHWAVAILAVVAAVDVLTLAADIRAGCEALALLTHLPALSFVIPFVGVIGWLLISHTFRSIERYLSLLCVVFVCYIASAVIAHFDVSAFARGVFFPHYRFSPLYASAAIALLGTTLTSYVYVWESIGIAERNVDEASIGRFEKDAAYGMVPIGIIFIFILVASAATLGRHHLPIVTANDMAAALEPLAGPWAGKLFGLGLLASAILAVPILASVTGYVAAHTFGWSGTLNSKVRDAKSFYAVVSASLVVAAGIACAPVSPIAMLYWASIAGGLATPLTLIFLMLVAHNPKIMGRRRVGGAVAVLGWGVTFIVCAAGVAFLFTLCITFG